MGQPISHRIDHMLSGTRSNIAIKLFGYAERNVQHCKGYSKQVNGVEGIADLNVEQQVEIPQINISPKRNMLARYGIPVKEFIEFVDIAFGGHKVTDVFEEERSFDMVLRFDNENRNDLNAIRNVTMTTYQGEKIPLHYIADIESSTGPNSISRENVKRKIVISANIAGRDLPFGCE